MEPTREQRYQRRIAELERQVEDLKAQIALLLDQVAKLSKNSSNSSKPPSSDVVKPPKPPAKGKKGKKKRRIGGQPGHEKQTRKPFGPEELDKAYSYELQYCPACGGKVQTSHAPDRVVQQVELVKPVEITEHRSCACWCPRCQKVQYGELPEEVARGGLVGPRLTALVAYLKGVCHASYSTIRKFFRDVMKITISRSQFAKLINKATGSLDGMYAEFLACLPGEGRLNVDETGHKENGQSFWTWCFRAELYTLFKIDPSRGSDVLIATLGEEFDGVLGCDYFSAYQKYMKDFSVPVQFCLAHLIRDVKFLTTLPDKVTRNYGERLLEALQKAAFSGLYAPYWKSSARGAIVGMTRYVNKGHIARAALEATAYQTREVLDAMEADSGVKLTALKVDGGMVFNELLMQFQADVLDVPVIRPKVSETTALGAAYAAGLAVGFWKDYDELRSNWGMDKKWTPAMSEDLRKKLYSGWKKAVTRTFDWVE